MTVSGTFSMIDWQEEVIENLGINKKLSRARVENTFSGILNGKLIMHYTLVYSAENRSEYSGIGHFTGTINTFEGEYIVMETGQYSNGIVTSTFDVRELSDTADFGISLGKGHFSTKEHSDIAYAFTPNTSDQTA